MDNRKTSADFYPGGKTPVTAGGGITSGEAGGAAGEPMVPVTKVEQLPEHYRESDMRSKINELARVISGGVAAIIAMVSLTLGAEPVKVLGVKKDALWNDDFVVTNVVADFAGFATTNTVTGATNALAATFERGLEVATNAVLQAGAKEIAAATNALSQSVDARLRASTNGSFSASSLEPYAKRTWVEGQGYLKSTNLTGYAQVNWVQNQGFIKKEDASGEIARIVNEKIAAQDETAAYRLMSADGSQWIDGTGVCWRVRSHVCVDNGAEMSSDGFVQEWQTEETSERVSFSDNDGIRRWEYCKVLTWSQTPDDPDSTWETVEYIYECETNLTAGTAILGLKTDNPWPDQNGVYPPERVILEYWLTTNAVTRLATTNDMPKVDISGLITTNDVCAIVTNEVAGYTEWSFSCEVPEIQAALNANPPGVSRMSNGDEIFYLYNVPVVEGYQRGNPESWAYDSLDNPTWMSCGSVYYNDDGFIAVVATRKSITRNALGLAMAKDVEKKFAEATNAIPSIVTNCVDGGYSAWTFFSDNAELESALAANSPKVESKFRADLGMTEWLVTFPDVDGFEKDFQGSISVTDTYDAPPVELYCGRVYNLRRYNPEWEDYEWISCSVSATRKKLPSRNALGLATLKDIEGAVTKQELTNTVRMVVNAAGRYVWDASLGVAWEARMHNGHLYYIAVTNKPPEVK